MTLRALKLGITLDSEKNKESKRFPSFTAWALSLSLLSFLSLLFWILFSSSAQFLFEFGWSGSSLIWFLLVCCSFPLRAFSLFSSIEENFLWVFEVFSLRPLLLVYSLDPRFWSACFRFFGDLSFEIILDYLLRLVLETGSFLPQFLGLLSFTIIRGFLCSNIF